MHERATNITLAAKPVALGADDVPPDRFIVKLLYAVVPPVPSRAANETKIPSTLAWLKAAPVIVTFPRRAFNVEPNENVTKDTVVIANAPPILTMDGRLKVVSTGAVMLLKFVPIVCNEGTRNDVQDASCH